MRLEEMQIGSYCNRKKALKKAMDVLKEPRAVGWTMTPYFVGKSYKIKVQFEEL